jgi:hypothetical protein
MRLSVMNAYVVAIERAIQEAGGGKAGYEAGVSASKIKFAWSESAVDETRHYRIDLRSTWSAHICAGTSSHQL